MALVLTMINYKLANELKDAGFPQDVKWGDMLYHDENKGQVLYTVMQKAEPIQGETKIPTLSELIEACGDYFKGLTHYEPDSPWGALAEIRGHQIKEYGKTPEEAVAKLWLKLNEHKNK